MYLGRKRSLSRAISFWLIENMLWENSFGLDLRFTRWLRGKMISPDSVELMMQEYKTAETSKNEG